MVEPAMQSKWRTLLWPSWTERKRAMRKQAWVVVVLAYAAVLFAWAWPVELRITAPTHVMLAWAAFMVWTFSLHIGLMLTLIAIVAAWFKRWRLALAAFPLAALIVVPVLWSYAPLNTPIESRNELRVMSVNLLMINRDTQPIIDEIIAADPDIVLLQEFTNHWRDALDEALGERYPHSVGVPQSDSFGAAIYSKRPFAEPPVTDLAMGRISLPQMRVVVEHAEQRVAVYNVHLLPPRTLAYTTEHRVELADLCDLLRDEPLPYVVAGDFNFTDATAHADAVRAAGTRDVWNDSGPGDGYGVTWPVHSFMRYVPMPGIRIDHVYRSEQWSTIRARTGVGTGSDHRPLVVSLALSTDTARPTGPVTQGLGMRGRDD